MAFSETSHSQTPFLAVGLGRSYGDVGLFSEGCVKTAAHRDLMISFDPKESVLHCQGGVTIGDIIEVFMPKGFFPPVVPGTKFVTVAGAIANDIHGKNHHLRGSFGCHVREIEIWRSDRGRLLLSPTQNTELFYATMGGIGLTGVILSAKIQLLRIGSRWIEQVHHVMRGFSEFLELDEASQTNEYTVAWIDSTAPLSQMGRGIYMRGDHSAQVDSDLVRYDARVQQSWRIPIEPPFSLVNAWTTPLLNFAFLKKEWRRVHTFRSEYDPFFFPLDKIVAWNKAFGRRGFFQYQFVADASECVPSVLKEIKRVHTGSFVTVLKRFGQQSSGGWLSFPKPGLTLTLDFPNTGKPILELMNRLDNIVRDHGGRVYLAKDARMSREMFTSGYPDWKRYQSFIDPQLSSSMWRRLNG